MGSLMGLLRSLTIFAVALVTAACPSAADAPRDAAAPTVTIDGLFRAFRADLPSALLPPVLTFPTLPIAPGQVRPLNLVIPPKRIVLWGDSRTFGALDPGDFLANPDPVKSSGTGYTSDPQVTINYNGSGSGAAAVARYDPITGQVAIGITQRGSGFTAGRLPTLTLTGGGGTGGDYGFGNGTGGGFTVPVETYLHAQGYFDVLCLNDGLNGATMSTEKPGDYRLLAAEASAQTPSNSVIVIDEGINDALRGYTARQYHDALAGIVSRLVADGFPVIIDKPYGIAPTFGDSAAAVNALVKSYGPEIEAVAAGHFGRAFVGWDGYAALEMHPEMLGDGLHLSPAGDAYVGPRKGAAYAAILDTLFALSATPVAAARQDASPARLCADASRTTVRLPPRPPQTRKPIFSGAGGVSWGGDH